MGLFSNKKKPCPICGSPTPRLFPTEIEGQPICKACSEQINLPDGTVDTMTLEDFRQYLADFDENRALWPLFRESFHRDFAFSSALQLDESHGLLRFKGNESWVIEKKYLKSFRILEDGSPLFESGSGTLKAYPSDIPRRVRELMPEIHRFRQERAEYDRHEEMEDMRLRNRETDDERRERHRISRMYRPEFRDPELLHEFRVELRFDHRYWPSFENTISAPSFDESAPSGEDYLRQYAEVTTGLHQLALRLMRMLDPSAGETVVDIATEPKTTPQARTVPVVATVDTAAEIKKYKELLDMGALTEEEFSAKKRQLLGL